MIVLKFEDESSLYPTLNWKMTREPTNPSACRITETRDPRILPLLASGVCLSSKKGRKANRVIPSHFQVKQKRMSTLLLQLAQVQHSRGNAL